MVGLFVGVTIITIAFIIWTKFNASEHKEISKRWEKLLDAEENKKQNFKKIKSAVVTFKNDRIDEIPNVKSYSWDANAGVLLLNNNEGYAVSVINLQVVSDVYFIREGEAE